MLVSLVPELFDKCHGFVRMCIFHFRKTCVSFVLRGFIEFTVVKISIGEGNDVHIKEFDISEFL